MMKVKKILKSNKGITLIALVITIIVLLILAGVAISMLTGDNGILKQAVKAKEETEKKSIQENIQLAVLSAMSNTNHELTLDNLTDEVKKQLGSDVEVEQDGIGGYVIGKEKDENEHLTNVYGVVDKEGKVGDGKWHFVRLTEAEESKDKEVKISDGETTLIVGKEIDYSPIRKEDGKDLTKEEFEKDKRYICTVDALSDIEGNRGTYTYKADAYKEKWGILGAENGKIMIVSMNAILVTETKDLGEYAKRYPTAVYMEGRNGYQKVIETLNSISKIYGYGKGAESARSITIEDINKITGYDPNYEGQNINKIPKEELKLKRYAEDTINEYGNQVKYYWNGTSNPIYEGSNGENGKLTTEHNSFNWYSGEWKTSQKPLSTNIKQYITTLTNSGYKYYPTTLTESNYVESEIKGISVETSAYKMLFNRLDDQTGQYTKNASYLLASLYCLTMEENGSSATLGIQNVNSNGYIGMHDLFYSTGEDKGCAVPIRSAVILKPDVTIKEEGGTYKIN